MKSSLLIIADRGNLKAYRVEKTANERPPRLNLLEAFSMVDAHRRISEQNTDLAGRFGVSGAAGGPRGSTGTHQASISDRHYEIETSKRLYKQIAAHIMSILNRENAKRWSLAAPSEMNDALLSELDPGVRKTIAENLHADLVHVHPSELLGRFSVAPVEV